MIILLHLAMVHGIFMIAAGCVAFHFAKKKSAPLNIAGAILVLGGLLILGWDLNYWFTNNQEVVNLSAICQDFADREAKN